MWEYMKVPEDSREKVKNLFKDANENGVKISH
jgi:transcriptional regulator